MPDSVSKCVALLTFWRSSVPADEVEFYSAVGDDLIGRQVRSLCEGLPGEIRTVAGGRTVTPTPETHCCVDTGAAELREIPLVSTYRRRHSCGLETGRASVKEKEESRPSDGVASGSRRHTARCWMGEGTWSWLSRTWTFSRTCRSRK